jgi:3-oxoacyl-[acyl-carrier protein] reductase
MKGKTALITGASRGIGREIALELARRKVRVAVNYCSDKKSAEEVVAEIIKSGGIATAFQADVSKIAEVEPLFDQVIHTFGKVDILVNNAGIMENCPIVKVTEKQFNRTFAINVKGLFFCCQQAATRMSDGGRIVNIGSSVTRVMMPDYGTYAASKGAVEQITKVLAKEVGSRSITVNTVSPGPTDTELFRKGKEVSQIKKLGSMAAFNRIAAGADIARVVAMICSDDASWITGQNIMANGGFIA